MTAEEKYIAFVNIVCEMLGFDKPVDILKLCQITSDFIKPYEMRIKELEKENQQLKQKTERMKNHENCKHHAQYSRMHTIYADDKIVCYKCKNCSLWELAE